MPLFEKTIQPDFQGMINCLLRKTKPERVYNLELYLDEEIREAVGEKFGLLNNLDKNDPFYILKRDIKVHDFLGYDSFLARLSGLDFNLNWVETADTTSDSNQARDGREWAEEHSGPIQSWKDFENYKWPSVKNIDISPLEWFDKNLPDGMKVHELTTHVLEVLTWAIGYETMCFMVFDQPDLIEAVANKIGEIYLDHVRLLCQFDCVGFIWASDDMGFKSQTFLPPDLMKKWILPWHKKSAEIAHEYGKPYLLHACGAIEDLMEDIITDVKIDARHSFEDTIIPVTEAKAKWGDRIGIIGGLDVDFLCRSDEQAIRKHTRKTLEKCHPDGGYCLGSGNSIANYMPLNNFLAMLDEGRKFS